tara:strand:- start:111 stop:647 length:537 start_codon:yes stop_codon:yes gene_type:complete
MARKKVDKVIEHRITFGDLERREFKQSMDSYQLMSKVAAAEKAIIPLAVTAVGAGVAYIGIKAYSAVNSFFNNDPLEVVKDTARVPFDWVKKYTGIDVTPDSLKETVSYEAPQEKIEGMTFLWPPDGRYYFALEWSNKLSEWKNANPDKTLPDGVTQEEVLAILQINIQQAQQAIGLF